MKDPAAKVLKRVTMMMKTAYGRGLRKGAKPREMMTMSEMIKYTGFDPLRFDCRPLNEVLNDEIPYQRWEQEAKARKAKA